MFAYKMWVNFITDNGENIIICQINTNLFIMKKRLLGVSLSLLVSMSLLSQGIGIGTTTPDISAALDVTATNKGLLIPRMNTNGILAIPTPARGLLVYDSLINQLMVNTGTPNTPVWQPVASSNSNGWSL